MQKHESTRARKKQMSSTNESLRDLLLSLLAIIIKIIIIVLPAGIHTSGKGENLLEYQNSCGTLDGEYICRVSFFFNNQETHAKMLSVNNVYTIVTESYGNMSADTVENLLQYSKHFCKDLEKVDLKKVVLQFSNNSRIKIFKDTAYETYFIVIMSENDNKKIKEGIPRDFDLQQYIENYLINPPK